MKMNYSACLLSVLCNTVAVFFSGEKVKVFDAHSRGQYGNACFEGSSVLLEFSDFEEVTCYVKNFYLSVSAVPFEVTGVNVSCLMSEKGDECGGAIGKVIKQSGSGERKHEMDQWINWSGTVNKDFSQSKKSKSDMEKCEVQKVGERGKEGRCRFEEVKGCHFVVEKDGRDENGRAKLERED